MRSKNNGLIHEERRRRRTIRRLFTTCPRHAVARERVWPMPAPARSSSFAELLAIILRVGGRGENVIRMAERVLTQFGGLTGLAPGQLRPTVPDPRTRARPRRRKFRPRSN
ncbi:MAG: UPF0758 domain-containing protein [Caldilineaceae bacterium]